MECPKCGCEMEGYAVENTKIVYRDNGEDTKIRMEKEINICPNCKLLTGSV